MLLVGLTGGIGCGKSTVARFFEAQGAAVLDADVLAKEAVARGTPGYQEVVDAFGDFVLKPDGEIDRRQLARIVFRDDESRHRLESIIHPRVQERSNEAIMSMVNAGHQIILYDVPLLFEVGLHTGMSAIIVVAVDETTQRERIKSRDGLTDQEISDRIAAQMPLEQKKAAARYVIDNSGTLEQTEALVAEVWAKLQTAVAE